MQLFKLVVLLFGAIFAHFAFGTPIVSVYQDNLKLSTYTAVEDIYGVVYEDRATYQGSSLFLTSKQILIYNRVSPIDFPDEPYAMSSKATIWRDNRSVYLEADAQFYYSGAGYSPTYPLWYKDLSKITTSAIAELEWVFSVDEDMELDVGILLKDEGIAKFVLYDVTEKEKVGYLNPPWHSVLFDVQRDSFDIFSGHKYRLIMSTMDTGYDDLNENSIQFVFSDDVTFQSVPEPSALILLGVGLTSFAFTRKRLS